MLKDRLRSSVVSFGVCALVLAACGNGAGTSDGGRDGGNPTDTGGDTMLVSDVASDAPADTSAPDESTPDVVAPDAAPDVTEARDEGTDTAPDAPVVPDVVTPDDVVGDTGAPPGDDGVDAVAPADAADGSSGPGDASSPADVAPDAAEMMCATGTMRCSATGACVDPQTDPSNCGMCGRACAAGQVCAAGSCGCAAGQVACGGACVNAQSDNENCGMCGNPCAAGQMCVMGACACPTDQTRCGTGATSTCVNTTSDNANCGGCGTACPAGRTCAAGVCACPMGQTSCGTGATATCVNAQTDNANCGACGTACTGGATCVMGACACPTGQTRCGTGATAACTDTQTDGANCGACGTACPAGQVCSAGACRSNCTAPAVACGTGAAMTCANTQTDDQNCGACGTVCGTVPNAFGGLCNMGACRPICSSGFANCNSTYADGCEVNTTNNTSNCGSCGAACPTTAANAMAVVCAASRCAPTCNTDTATTQFRDCNASVADGCEVNLFNDNNNCGACGTVCTGGQTCQGGRCTATSCNELHTRAPSLPSGIYWLDPDNAGPIAPFQAYCDMVTDGGGWTLVGRSAPGGHAFVGCSGSDGGPAGFGWRQSTGTVSDDTAAFSLNVETHGLTSFTQVLFGNYTTGKTWGDRIYRHDIPADFMSSTALRTADWSPARTATEVSTPVCLASEPAGEQSPGPTPGGGGMFIYMGYTNDTNNFHFRDVLGGGYGLFRTGWRTCYSLNNCYSGAINTQPGMLFIR